MVHRYEAGAGEPGAVHRPPERAADRPDGVPPRSAWLRWRGTFGALLAALIGLAGGCDGVMNVMHKPEPVPTPGPPPFRVGFSAHMPPFALEEGGRFAGIEIDFAHKLARGLEMRAVLVDLDWDDLIPALLDHRIDIIMSGMTITPAREARITFTEPYLRSSLALAVRHEDERKLMTIEGLKRASARLGVVRGTTGERFVRKELPAATVYAYDTAADGAAELRGRRIDALIADSATVAWLISQYEAELVATFRLPSPEEKIAWGVRRTDPDLLETANHLLDEWKHDGSLDAILDTWLPNAHGAVTAPPEGGAHRLQRGPDHHSREGGEGPDQHSGGGVEAPDHPR